MTPTLGGTIDSNFFAQYDATVQVGSASPHSSFLLIDQISRLLYQLQEAPT